MFALRAKLHRLTWIAFLALFGLVLAPSISRLLSGPASAQWGASWVEICTPQGMQRLAADASGAPVQPASVLANALSAEAQQLVSSAVGGTDAPPDQPSPSSSVHLDHCALCGLAQVAAALAPPATSFAPPALGGEWLTAALADAFKPAPRFAPGQARAPPAALV